MWALHTTPTQLLKAACATQAGGGGGSGGNGRLRCLWLELDEGGGSAEQRVAVLSRLGPMGLAGAPALDLDSMSALCCVVDAVARWALGAPVPPRPRATEGAPAGPAPLVRIPPPPASGDLHAGWDPAPTLKEARGTCLPLYLEA